MVLQLSVSVSVRQLSDENASLVSHSFVARNGCCLCCCFLPVDIVTCYIDIASSTMGILDLTMSTMIEFTTSLWKWISTNFWYWFPLSSVLSMDNIQVSILNNMASSRVLQSNYLLTPDTSKDLVKQMLERDVILPANQDSTVLGPISKLVNLTANGVAETFIAPRHRCTVLLLLQLLV